MVQSNTKNVKVRGKACGAEVKAKRKRKCMSFVKGSPQGECYNIQYIFFVSVMVVMATEVYLSNYSMCTMRLK